MNALRLPVAVAVLMFVVSLRGPAWAAAPAGQYVVSGTGAAATVYDTKSKLTWLKGSRLGTWDEGKAICVGLGATAGGTGWRLPTYKELLTLLDLSQKSATANDQKTDPVFPFFGMGGYWSATPDSGDATKAWNVNFFYGDTYTYGIANQNAVKCVR